MTTNVSFLSVRTASTGTWPKDPVCIDSRPKIPHATMRLHRIQSSSQSHSTPPGRICWSLYSLLSVVLWSTPTTVCAYRVGDVVDTDIVLDGVVSDALRNQRPLFGVDSMTVEPFLIENTQRSFALQFEGGLWTLPTAAIAQKGQVLEKIQVQFHYSRSGAGAIHAVHSNTVYGPSSSAPSFTVEYQWVAEEAVSLNNGFAVMFLAVIVASIFFIASSCGMLLESSPTKSRNNSDVSLQQQQHQYGIMAESPKWD